MKFFGFPLLGFCLFIFIIMLFFDEATASEDPIAPAPAPAIELEELRNRLDRLERRLDERPELRPDAMHVFWNQGLCFETRDRRFTARFSGKIHLDSVFMNGVEELDDFVESHGDSFDDGVSFRRGRIGLKGELYGDFIYKAVYEFASGDPEFKDFYVGMKEIFPHTLLRIGHFREPLSLHYITAGGDLRFLERSSIMSIAPSRNTGVGLTGMLFDRRMTWSAGGFYNTDNRGAGGSDLDLNFTARFTGLPWYEGDDRLLHLGVAYSRREEDDYQFTTAPGLQLSPDLIDTDGFPATDLSPHLIRSKYANVYGSEIAWVEGAFSAQAEYIRFDIDTPGTMNPRFSGFYVEGGYFLTGEHRAYRRDFGVPGSVIPESNFLGDPGGIGAVEVAARYSSLDLDDQGVQFGGRMADYALGVNWYLNPSVRVSANYIHAHLAQVGYADYLVFRVGLDF